MPKFKVGDLVKCVNPNPHSKSLHTPKLGDVCVVTWSNGGDLIKVGKCGEPFWEHRFELDKWVPKVGDVVTVNNPVHDWPYACGTFSKTYQLYKSHPNGLLQNPNTGNKENLWRLENDEGELFWVADHQLIRADGTQPSVPQRKKRIYNA